MNVVRGGDKYADVIGSQYLSENLAKKKDHENKIMAERKK